MNFYTQVMNYRAGRLAITLAAFAAATALAATQTHPARADDYGDAPAALPNTRPEDAIWNGPRRALVLLLEWDNSPAAVSAQVIEKSFLSADPQDFSVSSFFAENSNGRFTLSGKVLPWKKASVGWGRGKCFWNEAIDEKFSSFLDGCTPKMIAEEALRAFQGDFKISDYDSNGDGKIDFLFVVHSGRLFVDRTTPAMMFTSLPNVANHVAVFQSQGLGRVGDKLPIGFYLHEAGHEVGLFGDLYKSHLKFKDGHATQIDQDYTQGQYGNGMWGMMSLGCWGSSPKIAENDVWRYPVHFEAPSKVRLGWSSTHVFTKSAQHVRLRPVETGADVAVIPWGDSQVEHPIFLEYRTQRGFSHGHPGKGVLIWKGFSIIQADGRSDLQYGKALGRRPTPPADINLGDDSDPFPGSLGVTTWTDPESGVQIEHISVNDEYAEFDIVFPSEEASKRSYQSIPSSLRSVNKFAWPVSLNGEPFSVAIYTNPQTPSAPPTLQYTPIAEFIGLKSYYNPFLNLYQGVGPGVSGRDPRESVTVSQMLKEQNANSLSLGVGGWAASRLGGAHGGPLIGGSMILQDPTTPYMPIDLSNYFALLHATVGLDGKLPVYLMKGELSAGPAPLRLHLMIEEEKYAGIRDRLRAIGIAPIGVRVQTDKSGSFVFAELSVDRAILGSTSNLLDGPSGATAEVQHKWASELKLIFQTSRFIGVAEGQYRFANGDSPAWKQIYVSATILSRVFFPNEQITLGAKAVRVSDKAFDQTFWVGQITYGGEFR